MEPYAGFNGLPRNPAYGGVGSVRGRDATWGIAGVRAPEATARKVGNPLDNKGSRSRTLTDTGKLSRTTEGLGWASFLYVF